MFEKEAKEYAIDAPPPFSVAREAFQKGAEFGYNKAKEDADKMKSQFLELCNLKDMRIAELEKANEWHYPSKGEYPKEYEDIWICFLTEDEQTGLSKQKRLLKTSYELLGVKVGTIALIGK